jgi:cephalosporin hydroxylase
MTLFEMGTTFLGVNCSQSWADFQLWERLFNAHPGLRSVVELGTGEGGFSRYLLLQAEARGLAFATFDHIHMKTHGLEAFHELDIFENPEEVAAHFLAPTVIFCDNGEKAREVAIFGPLLHSGDILVVHDWNTEIFAKDIPSFLLPIHDEWYRELRSHSRIFMKA